MAEKIYKKKDIDPRFPKNRFVQFNKSGTVFVPHPDDIPGIKDPTKKLWEERLEECQKSDPKITKADLMFGMADVPDEYLLGSFYIDK